MGNGYAASLSMPSRLYLCVHVVPKKKKKKIEKQKRNISVTFNFILI